MASIFGKLGLADTDRAFAGVVGQEVIYETAIEHVNLVNAELDRFLSVFVERTEERFKERYKLPGGGHLDQRGPDGRYGAAKAIGQWDVAFPLFDYGREVAIDDVSAGYMSVAELENHINTVTAQNVNTTRFQMLKAILNNTQGTYTDPLHGSLSIEPLANGDAVVYPPVSGSEDEATEDHYLESGYTAANISDTNDPFVTIVDDLLHHFGGAVTGGSNIVTFISPDERAKTEALTDFVEVPDQFIRVGTQTDVPVGLPNVPGEIIGRHKHGSWVVSWPWMPSAYMLGLHMLEPGPLVRRVDPADTGLWRGGLSLVAQDERFPFTSSIWRVRFGFGGGNRLNGVVMELGTGGTYSIPSGYS